VLVESAVAAIVDDLGVPLDHAQQLPLLEDRRQVEDEVFKLERRIKNMGAINPDAADEYRELKERYDYLAGQMSDMESARRALSRIVRVIDARMKDDFANTFEQVNVNFGEIFSLLFPGGTAHLSLDDPDDLENTGVEVTAQPRGKRLTKMMLMSGGEKSLTALALLFAVYKTRATPFYILDEVEAALDDTNLRRLIAYIDTLRAQTQLIMITHQRRTMEMADVLFGVSMQADGVTKVISQKLERALEHSE
jgi:chromosome segregation protein